MTPPNDTFKKHVSNRYSIKQNLFTFNLHIIKSIKNINKCNSSKFKEI